MPRIMIQPRDLCPALQDLLLLLNTHCLGLPAIPNTVKASHSSDKSLSEARLLYLLGKKPTEKGVALFQEEQQLVIWNWLSFCSANSITLRLRVFAAVFSEGKSFEDSYHQRFRTSHAFVIFVVFGKMGIR